MNKRLAQVLAGLLAVCAVVFGVGLFKLNVLPGGLLALVVGAVAVLTAGVGFLLLGEKGRKRKIAAAVLALILAVGLGAGSAYIFKTISFMNTIVTEAIETHSFYVTVLADSEYEELDDIKGMEVSVMEGDDEIYDKAWDKLKAEVDVKKNSYDNFQDLTLALLNGDTEVIFINSAYFELAEDEVEGFNSDTVRILTTVDTEKAVEVPEKKKGDVTSEAFSVYISGIDTEGSIRKVSRSDVNMVVTVNPTTKEVLLTSIPRDYYVVLDSKGEYDKLTHSGIYGINETVSTVENLLDIDIDYYVKVNFTTVVKLVNALGGITVDSEYSFNAGGYHFNAGENYLNGEQALAFARERYSFAGGDRQRVKNQQAVITGILEKAMGSTAILSGYSDILASLADNMETNFTSKEITSLVKMQLKEMEPWSIDRCSLNGSGHTTTVYSMPTSYVYVMVPDEETVDAAKKKINDVIE